MNAVLSFSIYVSIFINMDINKSLCWIYQLNCVFAIMEKCMLLGFEISWEADIATWQHEHPYVILLGKV